MSLCINPQCQQPLNSDTMLFCKGCGSELLIDGRYRAIQELGQGGFGTTYEVLDLNSQPKVLKVLMDNHPKYVELFQQEAEILRSLNYPGIPKLDADGYFHYFSEDTEEPIHCIVMEKIEGLNLEEYLKKRNNRPIRQKRALRWLAELALILEQIHDRDFFHRDIKPPNIMLRANGLLAIIDFGTARQIDAEYQAKQASGQITGIMTPGYTPLEQMKGKALRQSDFYALGGTMIYLLTARNPDRFYDSQQNKLVWRSAVPNLDSRFADLIDSLVAIFPEDRPATAREIFNRTIEIEPSFYGLDEYFMSGSISSIPILNSQINPNSKINPPNQQNVISSAPPQPPQQQPQETNYIAPPPAQKQPQETNYIAPPPAQKQPQETNYIAPPPSQKQPQETNYIAPPPSQIPKQKPIRSSISPEFKARCRQALAEAIGPMATIVCDRTIAANPTLSEMEIVRALALKIPDEGQARIFTQKLFG